MGRPPTHFETGISYLLPGPWVDRLAYVFAQIDVAKQELDKRFVMKSDVLRDNKD